MRPRAPEEFRLPTQLTDQPSICSWTPLLPHKYLYQEGSTSVGLFRNPCLPASLIQRSDTCLASMCLRSCFNTYNHKGAEPSGSTKNDQTTNFIPALGPHTEKTTQPAWVQEHGRGVLPGRFSKGRGYYSRRLRGSEWCLQTS